MALERDPGWFGHGDAAIVGWVASAEVTNTAMQRLELIPGADHTFSQSRPRSEMIRRLAGQLARGFSAAPAGG